MTETTTSEEGHHGLAEVTTTESNGSHGAEGVPAPKGDVVLKVENISKKFCRNLKRSMLHGITDLAKGMVGIEPDTTTLRKDEFWALKDIDFELREGEILGIIGANGSGKSTLLRVLTGIFPPDKGKIWMDGTVGGIIALGAGMHPHMTGRENIYLNGTLFGMTRKEIDEKIDDIIDFSEIGDFMDAPFSAYSSGMKVRLGFAVAVHCQPEILLVDEVLAVGDLSFQNKCMRKLKEVRENSKGVIFISHNMDNIELLCTRVVVIDRGIIKFDGPKNTGIEFYESLQAQNTREHSSKSRLVQGSRSAGNYVINRVDFKNELGYRSESFQMNDKITIEVELEILEDVQKPLFNYVVKDESLNNVIWESEILPENFCVGETRILTFRLKKHHLKPGNYIFALGSKSKETGEDILKHVDPSLMFTVNGPRVNRGLIQVEKEITTRLIND